MERKEEKEQARLIRWCNSPPARAIVPQLAHLFHVPNGGKRSALVGAQMKALGVKRGIPDLLLPCPQDRFNGLAIEMKADSGSLSPDQTDWLDRLSGWDWCTAVCYSAEEARDTLAAYFNRPDLALVRLP